MNGFDALLNPCYVNLTQDETKEDRQACMHAQICTNIDIDLYGLYHTKHFHTILGFVTHIHRLIGHEGWSGKCNNHSHHMLVHLSIAPSITNEPTRVEACHQSSSGRSTTSARRWPCCRPQRPDPSWVILTGDDIKGVVQMQDLMQYANLLSFSSWCVTFQTLLLPTESDRFSQVNESNEWILPTFKNQLSMASLFHV